MFKVLVIAYYFPPMGLSGVQRTLKFVKYMKKYNWEPVVLTTTQTGYFAHDNSLLKEAENSGIKIVRVGGKDINSRLSGKGTVKMPSEIIRKILSRLSYSLFIPDNKISWTRNAIIKAREILKSEDIEMIFVSGPPFSSFTMAADLKEEFNLPLIVDYRDLWYGSQFAFYPTPIHKYLHKKKEYRVLKAADKIVTTNRKVKEKILSYYKFLTFEDIYIISHGYDPQDFENLVPDKKTNQKMILTYSGIFYEFITPKYLLKAFKKLSIERPDIAANIELHFVGILRKENERLIKKLDLQSFIKQFGYLDHKDALVKVISSDVLWLMVGRARNIETHSAGKLYEYFGSRKPILACLPNGALKSATEEYGACIITEPDNIEQIKNALYTFFELYKNHNLPLPNEEFVERHRRDYLTELLTKQFQFLIKAEI
ncbi:MAG TPA: glycosyltransferase [Ignavibacteriaceae bacterium]|nr:glycosyltransferase [Ignavibacteriaceae bacterium]